MDNDDRQIGRILSRREVLALLGTAGATLLVGCGPSQPSAGSTAPPATAVASTAPTTAATSAPNAEAATAVALQGNPTAAATAVAEGATAAAGNATVVAANGAAVPACVVRPEVTEGPYYVAENLVRSDIREDRQGTPLVLTFNVSQVSNGSCTALQGATVEIWHCDAAGQYSDVSDPGFSTKGQKWLRGAQVTDANGQATFTTIYPGWYSGRAVHIHFKVHPDTSTVFTSQLFFDDTLSQQVFAQAPYASKGSTPDTLNSRDGIYKDTLLLTVNKTDQGYTTAFDIGIQKG